MPTLRRFSSTIVFLFYFAVAHARQPCGGAWSLNPVGSLPGTDGAVVGMTTWVPEGSSPQEPWLAIAGNFHAVGGTVTQNFAAWDGTNWHALPGALGASYVGVFTHLGHLIGYGQFLSPQGTHYTVGKWNGAEWTRMGHIYDSNFSEPGLIYSMTTYQNQIVAVGLFRTAGATQGRNIAVWDGQYWQGLAQSVDGPISTACVHNGELIVGGAFTQINGVTANRIARWDGVSWQPLGSGASFSTAAATVTSLVSFDGKLYVAGDFDSIDGFPANRSASWDGAQWREESAGGAPLQKFQIVGSTLYACTYPRSQTLTNVVRKSMDGWEVVGSPFTTLYPAIQDFRGETLAAGYQNAGLSRFSDGDWRPLVNGENGTIRCSAIFQGQLLVGGRFQSIGGVAAHSLARWDGNHWSPWNDNFSAVGAMYVDDNTLYIAGKRLNASTYENGVFRWDAPNWTQLGPFIDSMPVALQMHNGSLYAGGSFFHIGTAQIYGLVRWNGQSWTSMGFTSYTPVNALTTWNNHLVVAGDFTSVGGVRANTCAEWDGNAWHALGDTNSSPVGSVHDLRPFNGELIMTGDGGNYSSAAVWNGASWRKLIPDITYSLGPISSVTEYRGDLVIAGAFSVYPPLPFTSGVLRRSNGRWSSLDQGIRSFVSTGSIYTMRSYNGSLLFGGAFAIVNEHVSPTFAFWNPCRADLDNGTGTGACDGGVTIDDLLYYLQIFATSNPSADLDDGSSTGTPDGGVTIDDLLFFLLHYAQGC